MTDWGVDEDRWRTEHDPSYPGFIERVGPLLGGPRQEIDVDRLARVLARELHIDEKHGFPRGFDAVALARLIASEYEND